MNKINSMANLFRLMSNDVRLCILVNLCKHKESNVTQLKNCSGASQSLVSQQLSKLKDNRIIASRKSGLEVYYYIIDKRVCEIINKLKIEK